MRLDDTHVFYQSVEFINQISTPLFNNTKIRSFSFSRYYHDGHAIELNSLDPRITKAILGDVLYPTASELGSFSSTSPFVYVDDDFHSHSGIEDSDKWKKNVEHTKRFEFYKRFYIFKKTDDYIEAYGFICEPDNPKPLQYCIEHIELLERFIQYFRYRAHQLLEDCHKSRYALDKDLYLTKPQANSETDPTLMSLLQCNAISDPAERMNATPAEAKCLQTLAQGNTMKEAARIIGISPRTVEQHISNLRHKVGAHSGKHLVRMYHEMKSNEGRV